MGLKLEGDGHPSGVRAARRPSGLFLAGSDTHLAFWGRPRGFRHGVGLGMEKDPAARDGSRGYRHDDSDRTGPLNPGHERHSRTCDAGDRRKGRGPLP